jgi:hypothetical protein
MTDYAPPKGCNPRKIICAANRYGDLIIPSARHHDKRMNHIITAFGGRSKLLEGIHYENLDEFRKEQGFIDQYGDYWTREQAMDIVKMNEQTIINEARIGDAKRLYSEHLY